MKKIVYAIMFLCLSFPVMALDAKKALVDIEKYINSLSTAKGKFKQLASSGGYATGDFYLSRPGKIRFEYHEPNNILLMADGDDFIYFDKSLMQVTYLGLDSSIAGVLVDDKFSFSNPKFKVEDVTFAKGNIRVAISATSDPLAGTIILIFKEKPLTLLKWQIIDAQGIATTILLEDMQYGINLDEELFVFEDPRHKTGAYPKRKRH